MANPKYKIDIKKYLIVFLGTSMIFFIGIYIGRHFEQQKLEKIDSIKANLELDILSTETQFSILETAICENSNSASLTEEQYQIEKTLSQMGERLGNSHPEVQRLRKYYFLLEIKNFLLMKKKKEQCNSSVIPILYFHGTKKECPKCKQQNFVLDYLKKYPFLKIYSFDYISDLVAVETLKSLYGVKGKLPILVINGKTYFGFKNREELIEILSPEFEEYKKEWEKSLSPSQEKNSPTSSPATSSENASPAGQ